MAERERPGGRNSVRIVGGLWRGRRVTFPPAPGLRPSPDRVRETLFNWIGPGLPGATCLDLFAGSGVLSFEAVSRGAAAAIAVDEDARITRQLAASAQALGATQVTVVRSDARAFLRRPPQAVDVVFVDPPFDSDLLAPCCRLLNSRGWLAPGALVYVESARAVGEPGVPAGWKLLRTTTAGEVAARLYRVDHGVGAPPARAL